ncbi:MAG TPA: DUF4438 domain-containing protein, partial [Planctomycetes bacterium]|nr:DUF4438 domain-containing protein [Planctomycetota bacterium]
TALNTLAQIGNVAVAVSGDARGAAGKVTGKHGGIEHVLVDFSAADMEKMAIGDKVQVRTFGLGLKFVELPHIKIFNLDPFLLAGLPVEKTSGLLEVGVAAEIPAELMGSGLGHDQVYTGDYDVQFTDMDRVRSLNLEAIRLGDIVAIMDSIHTHGRAFRKGAVSVGVVSHAACVAAGHGPGVTTIFSGPPGSITVHYEPAANIARVLKIGAFEET